MTRFIEPFFQPLGLLWLIHLFATVCLVRRRKWREAAFCGSIAVALYLIGATTIPTRLLASLERPYQSQRLGDVPNCDAIVMLGGVLNASSSDVVGFEFGDCADRVVTAVELFKKNKSGVLILGGGGGQRKLPPGDRWLEGDVLKPWLTSWGIATTNVLHLGSCSNTRDEALRVAALAKERNWRRIILVTSAYHMKRAAGLFSKAGIPFEPVACDFVGMAFLEKKNRFNLAPELGRFHHLELFVHEWIGWYYYRLRGWVASAPGK